MKALCNALLFLAVFAVARGEYEERRYRDRFEEELDSPDVEYHEINERVHRRSERAAPEPEAPWIDEEEDYMPLREHHSRQRRSREYAVRYDYDETPKRARRSPSPEPRYANHRYPDELHQYEVYEAIEEGPIGPPMDPMAAGSEHYHHVVGAAGAPEVGRYSAQPDQAGAASDEYTKHHAAGGGHAKHAGYGANNDAKSVKGYNSKSYSDKGGRGSEEKTRHAGEYDESAGKKRQHHDVAGHSGHHEEQAHGHKAGKFDEKKGHKKGHKTKGYHNKYHKDEFHKEHKFYDDYHKSGAHHRFGNFHAKHSSEEGGRKKAHHLAASHDSNQKSDKGHHQKGHVDADQKGHNVRKGHDEHHAHHSSHGKKGGHSGGSAYGFAKKA